MTEKATVPALDPEVAAFYQGKNFDYRAATVEEMRRNADAAFNDSVERAAIFHTEERTIPGPGREKISPYSSISTAAAF